MSEEQKNDSLTLVDLRNVLQVVDYAAQQGAFKGWDVINNVKVVRDRLAAFVSASLPAEGADVPTEAVTETVEEVAEPVVEKKTTRKKAAK